jgi:hypothetical protein
MNKKREKALPNPMTQDRHWHLDRKVPLAMMLTIAFQTGIFIWWAAQLSERVNTLERSAVTYAPNDQRLTRMEVKIEGVERIMLRLERLIETKSN